jgi:hypothetical protein
VGECGLLFRFDRHRSRCGSRRANYRPENVRTAKSSSRGGRRSAGRVLAPRLSAHRRVPEASR